MAYSDSRKSQRMLRAAGWLLLLMIGAAIWWHFPAGRKAAPNVESTPLGKANPASNAPSAHGLIARPTTNAPGLLVGPGVTEFLLLMQQWRQQHRNYRLTVETTGPEVESTTEVFRFVAKQGTVVNRMKTKMRQPMPLDLVMESEGERVRAYFPALEQVATVDWQQETAWVLKQIGWGGEALDVTLPVKLARASFIETGPDYRALTMVFPGALFKMPPAAGDLFLTIQLDDTGKVLSLEQLTLGLRVVSKLKYLDEDPARIEAASPRIPATAVATEKSFNEILLKLANWTRTPSAKPI